MNAYHLPRYLDEPFRFMIWTLDECVVFGIPFVIATFYLDAVISGLIVGGSLLLCLRKLKGDAGHTFLYQWAYWHLPPILRFKKMPLSYQRFYRG